MEPLVQGATDEIQTFFAFVVGKGLRAQRLPVKVGKETMVGKTVNALCPIDACGGKVFVEGEYLECDRRYVREKRRTRTNHSRRRIDDKSETRNLRRARRTFFHVSSANGMRRKVNKGRVSERTKIGVSNGERFR
jgi:hypothetical protein